MKESINKIVKKTCSVFGISEEDLMSRRRGRELVYARMICSQCISSCGVNSSRAIADVLKRNSSTIRYYLSIFEQEYLYNKDFRNFANAVNEVSLDITNEFHRELEQELNEIIG